MLLLLVVDGSGLRLAGSSPSFRCVRFAATCNTSSSSDARRCSAPRFQYIHQCDLVRCSRLEALASARRRSSSSLQASCSVSSLHLSSLIHTISSRPSSASARPASTTSARSHFPPQSVLSSLSSVLSLSPLSSVPHTGAHRADNRFAAAPLATDGASPRGISRTEWLPHWRRNGYPAHGSVTSPARNGYRTTHTPLSLALSHSKHPSHHLTYQCLPHSSASAALPHLDCVSISSIVTALAPLPGQSIYKLRYHLVTYNCSSNQAITSICCRWGSASAASRWPSSAGWRCRSACLLSRSFFWLPLLLLCLLAPSFFRCSCCLLLSCRSCVSSSGFCVLGGLMHAVALYLLLVLALLRLILVAGGVLLPLVVAVWVFMLLSCCGCFLSSLSFICVLGSCHWAKPRRVPLALSTGGASRVGRPSPLSAGGALPCWKAPV